MLYYWYRIIRILVERNFQKQVNIEDELTRTFRARLFDCDGLRVMSAFKYTVYMDFIRWELIARSKLYNEIVIKGNAPTLGSQKIIYRKPVRSQIERMHAKKPSILSIRAKSRPEQKNKKAENYFSAFFMLIVTSEWPVDR